MIDLIKYSSKAKQEYGYYLIKHLKQTGMINQKYNPIKMMIADLFTKPLRKSIFPINTRSINLCDSETPEIKEELLDINRHPGKGACERL